MLVMSVLTYKYLFAMFASVGVKNLYVLKVANVIKVNTSVFSIDELRTDVGQIPAECSRFITQ